MQRERTIFNTFLSMHAHKAQATEEPRAHMMFYSDKMTPDAPLLLMDRDDVLDALDCNSELVRWLLEQMRTYDCRKQRIVGLVFDRGTVLSEVLRVP